MENSTTVELVRKSGTYLNHLSACLLRINTSYGVCGVEDHKIKAMLALCLLPISNALKLLEQAQQQELELDFQPAITLLNGMHYMLEELITLDLDREYNAVCIDALMHVAQNFVETCVEEWGDL